MVPASQWKESVLKKFEPKGRYLTKDAAFYPPKLNQYLAFKMVSTAVQRRYSRLAAPPRGLGQATRVVVSVIAISIFVHMFLFYVLSTW